MVVDQLPSMLQLVVLAAALVDLILVSTVWKAPLQSLKLDLNFSTFKLISRLEGELSMSLLTLKRVTLRLRLRRSIITQTYHLNR
jgi:hypothetical protein